MVCVASLLSPYHNAISIHTALPVISYLSSISSSLVPLLRVSLATLAQLYQTLPKPLTPKRHKTTEKLFLVLSTLCAAWLAWISFLNVSMTNQAEDIILSSIYNLCLDCGTHLCLPALFGQYFSWNLQELGNIEFFTNLSELVELFSAGEMIGMNEGYLSLPLSLDWNVSDGNDCTYYQ